MRDPADLYERASSAHRAGRYAVATRLLDAASASEPDADLAARIELTRAYVEAETGDPVAGLARCQALLDQPGVTKVVAGLTWSQIALLHVRAGRVPEALGAFSTAIDLLSGEPGYLGRAYLNRGTVHLQKSDAEAAGRDLTRAVALLSQVSDEQTTAKARHNLGYVELLRGNLVNALEAMDSAAPTLVGLSPVIRANVEQDRAEVLLAAGRTNEAVDALEAAASAYGSQKLRRFQAEAEFVWSRTMLQTDPARARLVARRAKTRFEDHDSPVWAARAEALSLGAAFELGRQPRRSRDRADELIGLLRRSGHRRDAGELALRAVRGCLHGRELDDAATRLRRVRITDDTPIGTRLLAREVKAELAVARGRRRQALAHVRAGLSDLHDWQASFGSLDLQSSLVGHGNTLARLGLQLALEDGRPEVVFEWSERARALASRVTSLRPPPDPELAADLTALRLLDPSERAKARELRERIRTRTWYAAQGSVGEPATLEELQSRLRVDHAALVAHIVLDDQITALVVTGHSARVVPLDGAGPVREQLDRIAADLDFAAHNSAGPFGATVQASLAEDLGRVAEELVSPVLELIEDRRVVLTPSALLAGAPWSLLPGFKGRPLTVPTSATRWLELVTAPQPPLERIGLVAGPRVERAAEEVERAAAAWRSADLLHGDDANSAKVGEVASEADVLHLAGHGTHAGDHPLFSAVELADGPWFGHDIDLLPRTPSVVVLSACELGQVSVLRGEETVGMTAAWLHAGARTVLSSPALVADAVACDALAHWHRLVAAGRAPADALAEVVADTDGVVPFLCFGAGW